MPIGPFVHHEPRHEPAEPQHAGQDERPVPAEAGGDEGYGHRRDDRADVGARVEQPRGERALALREPFRDRFDRGGKVSRLAKSEDEAHENEAGDRRGVGQADGSEEHGGRGTEAIHFRRRHGGSHVHGRQCGN